MELDTRARLHYGSTRRNKTESVLERFLDLDVRAGEGLARRRERGTISKEYGQHDPRERL